MLILSGVVGRAQSGSGESYWCRSRRCWAKLIVSDDDEGGERDALQSETAVGTRASHVTVASLCSATRLVVFLLALRTYKFRQRSEHLWTRMSALFWALLHLMTAPMTRRSSARFTVSVDLWTVCTSSGSDDCWGPDHIEKNIKPQALSSECPSLPVLVYAIRNILQPSFILQEIPALLRLIVHLETLRQRTVSTMERIICDANKPDLPLSLNTEDHRALVQLTGAKRLAAQRTVYRKIINGCSLLVRRLLCPKFCVLTLYVQHIHHLWRIYDPETDKPLTDALIDYFPTFVMRDPDMRDRCRASLKAHPWHYGLTEEERAGNRETGQRAAEFLVGAAQYLEDPAAYCSDNECVSSWLRSGFSIF